jgi:plastocyanin
MNFTRIFRLSAAIWILLCSCSLSAAEVRGVVSIDYDGLYQTRSTAQAQPVSVALLPGEGQRTVPRGARKHRIEIIDNRMHPAFVTVKTGDIIEFTNRDTVFHELFSLSQGRPMKVQLGKAVGEQRPKAEFVMDSPGATHFFCRIHNKSYARVDAVNTPYLQTLQSGGEFRFVGLSPGKWRLRIAASAAETRWFDVVAMTKPPMLDLVLTSHAGTSGEIGEFTANQKIHDLYIRPDGGAR